MISPRRTLVFSNSLLLRWFAVEGATTYRVRVAGAGVNWETLVSEPFAIYEGTLLQPGQMYLVSVDADNGTASSTTVFSTVNEAQRTQIQQQLDLLDAMALDDSQRAISEARIYADSGAMADAIEVLEAQVRAGSDNAEVYCLLASLYQQHYGTLDLADLYTELLNQVDRLGETCTTP
ncbi:MAG: fibronectin type III domain-containing protein [Cyanobacteria bacterium SID2]|nr:fibronectin type III domain-containing protein [Cyanobacteria bacterium SID2]MBP0004157.1 fibronectin type III domain-containing protein [Cyanobacteria bacterium SBC]